MATENATRTAEFYLEHEDEYPVHAKLATVDIELEDGSFVTYFDLPADQQVQFLTTILSIRLNYLTKKLLKFRLLRNTSRSRIGLSKTIWNQN